MTKILKISAILACVMTFAFIMISVIFCTQNVINDNKSILKNAKNENNIAITATKCDKYNNSPTQLKNQGHGAVLIEQSSKRVLWGDGEYVRCYPASTTKILTAYIALQWLQLDKIVTIPKAAQGVEGSSLYLKEGDKISVEDLLYGLMLRSGNDCAVALALEVAGCVENFAVIMNKTARKCGAFNSNFVNPHGLHDEMHYTTAHDLSLITARAYDDMRFEKIVDTQKRKIIVNGEPRYIANKNKMLSLFEGANGVKTGYTKKSGRCLVSGAKRDGMQLICVVLNHSDMWNDSVRMLNFGFDNFQMIPLDKALLYSGDSTVEVRIRQNVTKDWKDIYYPVRRDGSESVRIVNER